MAANTEAVANKTESAISELPFNNYTCANCDIKFDSESSLRVHLQVSFKMLPVWKLRQK